MGTATNNNVMTNRDEIVGLPALVVRDFLKSSCQPITQDSWTSSLSLSSELGSGTFELLIAEGYVERQESYEGSPEWLKTRLAVELINRPVLPPIPFEKCCKIALNALIEVQHLNFSSTASRVENISFYGTTLRSIFEPIPYLQVSVEIRPMFDDPIKQRELEVDSSRAYESGLSKLDPNIDRGDWSRHMFKDRLLRLSPYLCVRVV